ncbi:transcriptional regulator, XRE family [Geobacter metallireducens RCH3]|uniref:Helix-turn-helix XRE domain protein n=1 Tax=Geobacter metallireducens (strain ATCC 53774 / DSM 7210 / GS-15) TaxID=269799 RepID=Q39QU7_GEOMG|nr:helix-turn-helix transcriptional regulator [Geobacter metallireducens]ABB33377.1 helix-turn-helix XRE domain protein [Geobacter metallireducens GS-15]EHP85442.1 transcriptional regulator, XRE family [Geobacter metallireducens RCH3]
METQDEKSERERSVPPIVAIDGTAIKRIREAKKLTQLYVASVVGVTTDTISRWENNRYPTIKRDNAEKVATALEVSLEEILKPEPVSEPEPEPEAVPVLLSPRKQRLAPLVLAVGLGTLLVALIVGAVLSRRGAAELVATRVLPPFGAPGQLVPVQVKVDRRDGEKSGFIVKERIPAGWRFVASNPPVAGEAGEREVKWLIPPGGTGPVTISYTLTAPRTLLLGSQADFGGEVILSHGKATRRGIIGGPARIVVNGRHWADTNGDGRIDDNEIMPAYYLCEEMRGLGLDWKTIETIWSGAGYTWNDKLKVFEVVK